MKVERQLDLVLISLHGDVDSSCEEPFREEVDRVLDERAKAVLLDLQALDLIDTPGLRMLLSLHGRAQADGLDFTVLCESGGLRRVLRETGIDGLIPIVDESGPVPPSDSPV